MSEKKDFVLPKGTPTEEETAERARRTAARKKAIEYFGDDACFEKEIHHTNGNNEDNRKENMELLTKEDHATRHGRGNGKRGAGNVNNLIKTAEMKNVEILEAGIWNGLKVTEAAMDEMVKNFQDGILEPFINLDHDDKFTDNVKKALSVVSLGFVSHLRREGKKLIANFKQVPQKVADLIKSGMLKKRSVEFFPEGFTLNGSVYKNVLKAVSFFGADVPAVNSLSDDFDILLKSKQLAINFNSELKPQKINLTRGLKMDEITVSKKEYDELVTFKTTSSTEVTKLQQVNGELETQLKTSNEENEKLAKFQKAYEAEKAENLTKEAGEFISKIIEEGKLLPKFKDDKVSDYIEKSTDETKLKLFKEDLETRDKVINLGNIEDKTGNGGTPDISKMTNDEIDEAITAKMKADGISWDAASKAIGFGEEV